MDLCVFILRDRIGTPTPRAESGTAEEYGLAVAARKGRKRPEIWACFGTQTPGLKGAHAIQQSKARAFRDRISPRHVRFDYGTPAHFGREFERFLGTWVSEYLAQRAAGPSPRGTAKGNAGLTTANALLLGDRLYRATKPTEEAGRWTVKIQVRTPAEVHALGELDRGYSTAPYAFGLTGGSVRVSHVEFGEERGRSVAVVTFDTPHAQRGMGHVWASDDETRERWVRTVLLEGAVSSKEKDFVQVVRGHEAKPVVVPLLTQSTDDGTRLEARLRAVHALFEAGLVTEIERLTLSDMKEKGVKVSFVGRARSYLGGEAPPLRIEGYVAAKKRGGAASAKAKTVKTASKTKPKRNL